MSDSLTLPAAPGASPAPSPVPSAEMTMAEHLAELRQRVLWGIGAFALATVGVFSVSVPLINALKRLAPPDVQFVQLAPGEALMAGLRLSIFLGLVLASPVILYQAMRFVLPGLHRREARLLLWITIGGAVLFLLGSVFAAYAVIPPSLAFLLDYGRDVATLQMSIDRFLSFCTSLLVLTGILFELPMVLFLLSFTGLVTSAQLLAQWRKAVVGIFLLSAFVTPSQDPVSMALVGLAMTGLYLASLVPIRLFGK